MGEGFNIRYPQTEREFSENVFQVDFDIVCVNKHHDRRTGFVALMWNIIINRIPFRWVNICQKSVFGKCIFFDKHIFQGILIGSKQNSVVLCDLFDLQHFRIHYIALVVGLLRIILWIIFFDHLNFVLF